MEKNYFKTIAGNYKNWLLLLILLFMNLVQIQAQVSVDFSQRTSQYSPEKDIYNINGDFTMIGNTNLTLQNYAVEKNNSANAMILVDKDGDPTTSNSSGAELIFSEENDADPLCSKVIYAGLYWTARTSDTTTGLSKRSVKIKGPGGTYQVVTANSDAIKFPGDTNMYVAYAEVTDIVKNGKAGEYWVADMELSTGNGGSTGYYGGWGMVVIYENSKMNLRDVTVYDGYAYVAGNATLDYEIPVSGFNTAQNGAVNMKLGLMAGEGDRGISGDYFEIQKNSDTSWSRLNHNQNSTENFFNSSIKTQGERLPELENNTGLDISMFDVPNEDNAVIGNNQTATKFRYGSTQDTYVIFNMVMSVDAYMPLVEGISSVDSIEGVRVSPPFSVVPGEEITYKIEIKNKGSEPIENTKLVIPVPYNLSYLESSAPTNIYFSPNPTPNTVTYDPTLGENGSIVWDIGQLPVAQNTNTTLADLRLKFKVTEDCSILKNSSCGDGYNILFNGQMSGKGAITGTIFNNKNLIQGFNSDGACQGEPITSSLAVSLDATDYIQQNCENTPEDRVFVYCNPSYPIPVTAINSAFPSGTRFYNEFPITENSVEYNINNPFPDITGNYFAVLPNSQACNIPFSIVINEIRSVPETENIEYCLNAEAAPLTATPSNSNYQLFYYETQDGPSQLSITPDTSIPGEFTFYVAEGASSSCISPNKIEIKVSVLDTPNPPIATTVDLCISDDPLDLFEMLSGDNDQSGTWEDPDQTGALSGSFINPELLAVGNYSFRYALGGNCPSSTLVSVSINDDCIALAADCDIDGIKAGVSKAVTPNGDGYNDFFTINVDTECGFDFGVQIYNRWGAEIYSNPNYRNQWDGFSNRSFIGSNQLPSGTYFYILTVNNGNIEPIQGYIYLGTK